MKSYIKIKAGQPFYKLSGRCYYTAQECPNGFFIGDYFQSGKRRTSTKDFTVYADEVSITQNERNFKGYKWRGWSRTFIIEDTGMKNECFICKKEFTDNKDRKICKECRIKYSDNKIKLVEPVKITYQK